MKKTFAMLLLLATLCAAGCSNFDARRVTTTQQLKQNHIEDVERALQGKLTDNELRSSLQSYDAAAIEEQAKSGKGLDELQKQMQAQTDAEVKRLFPGR